jgi:hypothetical protein
MKHYAMKVYGSGCIDPYFLDLGTSWRWVVSFTPLPLYSWYPSNRSLTEPRAGLDGMEKWKFLTPSELDLGPLGYQARRQSFYRRRYPDSWIHQLCSFFKELISTNYWNIMKTVTRRFQEMAILCCRVHLKGPYFWSYDVRKATSCVATQELPSILWNPKVHYHLYHESDQSSLYYSIISL